MRIKPLTLLNIALAICLLTTLFFASGTLTDNSGIEYDPWIDTNDDGKIDMKDIGTLCLLYGAEGTPINKTALLLELLERVDGLNASLLDLEAYLETKITELNMSLADALYRVGMLEDQMLPQGFMRAPTYDSGWVNISQGEFLVLTHNLNTTNLLVYVVGHRFDASPIHQVYYGWDRFNKHEGLYWCGTNTTIVVDRAKDDVSWDQVRVMIWKIQEPPT